MHKVLLSDLTTGMITAEDVYSPDHQLIAPKGVVLTENLIARLFSFDIFSIRIADDVIDNSPIELPEDASYAERLKASPEFVQFHEDYAQIVDKLEFSMNALVQKSEEFDAQILLTDTMELINQRKSGVGVMDMILNIQDFDDCTFAHSLNVALICNIFATWLHFSDEDRELATACGLFHDVGKLAIPADIIKKPGPLTPAETRIIRTHPLESYKLLTNYQMSEEVKDAALMHHERCDGSGYPYGFTADKISRFAKLVSIADVYEAMTSRRSYRDALCPFQVITHFENDGLQKYDPEFILVFLENVVNTFLNQKVRLSNGLEGKIVYINPTSLGNPTIQVEDKFVDLKQHPGLEISAII